MKMYPVGVDLYIEGGLAKVDFSCPNCLKKYEGVIIGGRNEPEKCECGCEFEKVRFGSDEDERE